LKRNKSAEAECQSEQQPNQIDPLTIKTQH